MGSVAIFWDLENVTPTTESLFIDGLWDYAESFGRVAAAKAYCDWSKPDHKKLGPALARLHFSLVHVPRARGQKNSADMNLISDTLEVLSFYDHIDTFVLVTGDSDFRPLVLALRRAGKKIQIVCDLKKASQDLLSLSDSFRDYREIVPGVEDEAPPEPAAPEARGSAENGQAGLSLEDYFELLAEAAAVVEREGKDPTLGTVKIRLQMLNSNFSEKALGFKRWSDFVAKAARAGYVRIVENDREALVYPPAEEGTQKKSRQLEAFDRLVSALSALDQEEGPGYHVFARVNSELRDTNGGFDLKSLGFRKFKEFIQAAEARGLVESTTEGLQHMVRKTSKPKAKPQQRRSRKSRSRAESR